MLWEGNRLETDLLSILMVTSRIMMMVIWVCVSFFLPTISKPSTNTSESKDHSQTRPASAIVLDHCAPSPTSSSPSRKRCSLPFGGDCKGEFSQMLVAMGIRVRKRPVQWKLVSQHKTLPFRYNSLRALWGPGWKWFAKKWEIGMSQSTTFKHIFHR